MVRVQAAVIRAQAAMREQERQTFATVSEAARIGFWECRLPSDAIRWTRGVYDLFDMPRSSNLDRRQTLAFYEPDSLKTLNALRTRAIAEHSGFSLDAAIVTPKGRDRWIRITASVEAKAGVANRIFGLKQDITEEKILGERTRRLAEADGMTGLANRARFEARLQEPLGTLLLIDLDGFKQVNDRFGHTYGDECLRQASVRLAKVCRQEDFVARIGGDEFAVVLADRPPWSALAALATRIIAALGESMAHRGCAFRVGASVGIAFAGQSAPSDLFEKADRALYAAKSGGRDTFRRYDPSMSAPAG